MKETELKKLFQKKFAERELPYNAASWEKLAVMLDQASVPWYAKSGVWIKAASSIAAITIASALYIYNADPVVQNDLPSNSLQENSLPQQELFNERPASSISSSPENETLPSENTTNTSSDDIRPRASTSTSQSSTSLTIPQNQASSNRAAQGNSIPLNSAEAFLTHENLSTSQELYSELSFMEWKAKKLPNLNPAKTLPSLSLAKPNKTTNNRIRWRPNTHWSFGIQSLVGMSSSFDNPSNGSTGLNSFGLGLNARYFFASIWTLETNLNYTRRSGMTMNREIVGTRFGFGSEEESVAIETQSIDFIEVPVFLGIRLAPSHRFKAGYFFAPIVNIRNQVTHSLKPMNSDVWEHSTQSESGYAEAFEKLDHGWAFGYEWTPTARFGIGLDYLHGLTDLSINAHFNENYVDFNRQVKLRLAYYFY